MRQIPIFLGLAGLCALTACVTTNPNGAGKSGRPAATGIYTNIATGFYFPPHLDGFQRTEVTPYNRQGTDFGVGYNELSAGIAVTVFVYPIPKSGPDSTLDGHYADYKEAVLRQHDDSRLISEQTARISPHGIPQTGHQAIFTYTDLFARQRQTLRSELFLFTHGQQFVLYRMTYPASQQSEADPAIAFFMEDFPWP